MRWTTTDPRSAGFADSEGATINYVSSGAFVTLLKTGSGSTDWSEVKAIVPPTVGSRCPVVTTDPRTAGRAGSLDEVVLYTTGGTGTYLIKYGTGNTDWVPLPTMPIIGVGNEGDVYTTVSGVAVWQAPSSGGSSADPIFSGGQDGAINFNGGAVTVATGPVANVYTLTQNVAATDINVAVSVHRQHRRVRDLLQRHAVGQRNNPQQRQRRYEHRRRHRDGTRAALGAPAEASRRWHAGGNGAINAMLVLVRRRSDERADMESRRRRWCRLAADTTSALRAPQAAPARAEARVDVVAVGTRSAAQAGSALAARSARSTRQRTHSLHDSRPRNRTALFGSLDWRRQAHHRRMRTTGPGVANVDGAGGGGAGGWIVIAARNHCTFTGTVESKGGAGGSGYSFNVGGAAGGIGGPGAGGGPAERSSSSWAPARLPTFDVTGGLGGTGGSCTGGTVRQRQSWNGGDGGSGKLITRVLG
jgi:hypothetical protein